MTVKIHGKDYVEVNERLIKFWKDYPSGSIETDVLKIDDNFVLIRAIVKKNKTGRVSATGHAFENKNSSPINKTSYVENCETSAIGRALGLLGYGIETSVASAEEVTQAIDQQNSPPKKEKEKREKPEDPIWESLTTAYKAVGKEIYEKALKECKMKSPISVADANTLCAAINRIADA